MKESTETALSTIRSLQGPTISGKVEVPLAELDKMRADHANAVQAAKFLAEKQMMVRVVIVEDMTGREREHLENRFVKNTGMREIGVSYCNLEEVQVVLEKDLRAKLQKELEDASASVSEATKRLGDKTNELSKARASEYELAKENEGLVTENESLNTKLISLEAQVLSLTEMRDAAEKKTEEVRTGMKEAWEKDAKKAAESIQELNKKLNRALEDRPWWKFW